MIRAADSLAENVGIAAACRALRLSRCARYRNRAARHVCPLPAPASAAPLRHGPLALSELERRVALDVLNSPRFANCAPAAIHAPLLDEGRYVASCSPCIVCSKAAPPCANGATNYAIPSTPKQELLAVVPNQVWSWDITKLKGPVRETCFHLYVIVDIFSHYVVGWMVTEWENAELTEQLIADTSANESIKPRTLTLHADRGSSMHSKAVVTLLSDLASSRRTAGPTSRATTRTRRRSSKP